MVKSDRGSWKIVKGIAAWVGVVILAGLSVGAFIKIISWVIG